MNHGTKSPSTHVGHREQTESPGWCPHSADKASWAGSSHSVGPQDPTVQIFVKSKGIGEGSSISLRKEHSKCLPASRRHVLKSGHLEIVTVIAGGLAPVSVHLCQQARLPTTVPAPRSPAIMTEMVLDKGLYVPWVELCLWAPDPQAGKVGWALG